MLEVKELTKLFPVGRRRITAVNDVSFRVEENEIFGIVGESGCGKSTLGRLILRLIEPSGGQVFFKGQDISALRRRAMRPLRRSMQMVFQNPFASFNPKIRILSALTEVCRYYGMSADETRDRIGRLFADIGLSEDLLYRWPRELSGGQLQRLAIARALLSDPSLIVADEPLSALDVSVQAQLLNLLKALRGNRSMAMVFISHDMTVVEYLCDRVGVMYLGRIMELLPGSDLSENALHPYTRSLRASSPRLDRFKDGEKSDTAALLKGETPDPSHVLKGCPFAPRCPEASKHCREEIPEIREAAPGHLVRCHLV
ncbi:oligopeptide transport ATP-binding protein AppF [Spirochaetia bacterium]|nr:oligopeptide transport ATP-binding protein AppF [Spirochaetia bacterium]